MSKKADKYTEDGKLIFGDYEIKVPTIGDVPELFDVIIGAGGENELPVIIKNMVKACVFKSGSSTPIADEMSNLPVRDVKAMVPILTEMVDFNGKK